MNTAYLRKPALKMRVKCIDLLSQSFSLGCRLIMPLMPVVMSLIFLDTKYFKHYRHWFDKFKIHFDALAMGPVTHYLSDVMMRHQNIPEHIQGECVQCGNCCLNKQCAFLEPIEDHKFQCSIYDSRWRKMSNCNSFPINARDIDRYQCPSYQVVNIFPARTSR